MTEAAKDRRKLTDEEKLQRLKEKQEALQRSIKKQQKELSEKNRKLRTRNLIDKGGLVEIAGLLHYDSQTLVGALLDIAQKLKTETGEIAGWKKRGAYVLSLTPQERKEQGIGDL